MKELYEKVKLLSCVQYNIYLWNTCGDLKVIVLLVGMQLAFTRFCCFLCEWDFGTKDCHCCMKEWYRCEQFQPGQKDIRNEPLVHLKKIFLLSLHVTKSFVKVLDHDGKAFHYLLQNSPQISETKIREGNFFGPQMWRTRILMHYSSGLKEVFQKLWKVVAYNFLGIHKSPNYRTLVENMLNL